MAASRRKRRRSESYTQPGRRGEGTGARARSPRPGSEATPSRRARSRDRPPAPWGNFPLVELCVLVGLVLLGIGFFTEGDRGVVLIACGVTLASLAGLELSVREHLAGFRSHSTVLAGALAVIAVGLGYFLLPSKLVGLNLPVGALVFGIAFYAFRELFKRRSGGLGFR